MAEGGHPGDPAIRCDACRYYAVASRYGRQARGECRYRAPRSSTAAWPAVRPDDWCRHWISLPLYGRQPEAGG